MQHRLPSLVFLLACLAGSNALSQVAPPKDPPLLSAAELRTLLGKLRNGGYVIYFRHLDTRQDQEDRQPVDLKDCAAQRNLSDAGRARGESIGRAFASAKIPVGDVVGSPFCRTLDTARLIAGRASIDNDLFFAIGLDDAGKREKGAALRRMLGRVPARGKNTLIVGHTANLQEAVGWWPKPEGIAYVLRPDGQGNFEGVARISPDSWAEAVR